MVCKRLIAALLTASLLIVGVQAAEPVAEITPIISQSPAPQILPTDIQIRQEFGVDLLVKTFEVPPDTNPDQFAPQELGRGGIEYTLREIIQQAQTSSASVRQTLQTVTISADSDRREDILSAAPAD